MRRLVIILAFLFTFREAGVFATQVIPLTLGQTVRSATAIAVVRVERATSRWGDASRRWMVTDYEVRIEDVILPSTDVQSGSTTTLTFWGGTIGDETQRIAGISMPSEGARYLVMLDGQRGFTPVVGLTQGLFPVKQDPGTGIDVVFEAEDQPLRPTALALTQQFAAAAGAGTGAPSQGAVPLATFVAALRANLATLRATPAPAWESAPARNQVLPRRTPLIEPRTEMMTERRVSGVLQSREPMQPTQIPEGDVHLPAQPSGSVTPSAGDPIALPNYSWVGRANLPIVVNNLPDSFAPWSPEDEFLMSRWNFYSDVFRVYTTPTGTYAWTDGVFDLAGFPSSADMTAVYGAPWGSTTLGITFTRYVGAIGTTITEGDIAINPAFGWTLDDEWEYDGSWAWTFRQTMIHELGHMWGLQHNFNGMSLMNYFQQVFRAFGLPYMDDAEAIRSSYGGPARNDLGVYMYRTNGFQSATDADYPGSVIAGRTLTVSNFWVENVGTITVAPTLEWYLTPARNFNSNTFLGSTSYNALARFTFFNPGSLSASLTVPASLPVGNYYLAAFIRNDEGASQPSFPISNDRAFTRFQIRVDPSRVISLAGSLAFGSVPISQTAARTLTIYNDGNSTMTVSSISYPSGFTGNWSGGTIAAGGFRSVTVTFAPTSLGAYGGTIFVNANETDGTSTRSTSGTGIAQTRVVALSGSLAFGSVAVNTTAARIIAIANNGNSTLTVISISYPAGFSGSWPGGTIAVGGSQNVTVTFAPTAVTPYSGNVIVNGNHTSGTNTMPASGVGMSRIVSPSGNLAFGNVRANRTATRTLTIGNPGTGPLTVFGILYPAAFSGNWPGGIIPAGGSQSVTVTFAPTAIASYSGNITINGNQTSGVNTIAVSGAGERGPIAGDFDGDGKSDITVFRPSSGTWWSLLSSSNYTNFWSASWGLAGDQVVAGDYDGDKKDDFAVFRPSNATWYFLGSLSNFTAAGVYAWGLSTDVPQVGDFDGDGKSDPTVYRPSNSTWYILNSNSNYTSSAAIAWGTAGDVTVSGDYDGDDRTDLAVFRPSTGEWFILKSSTNYTTFAVHTFGVDGDIPVPGDYDGDGKADLAVFRPSTAQWLIAKSSTAFTSALIAVWGVSTDTLVPADYDGDLKTDIAVFRPSTGEWFILKSTTNSTTFDLYGWGMSSDLPVNKSP